MKNTHIYIICTVLAQILRTDTTYFQQITSHFQASHEPKQEKMQTLSCILQQLNFEQTLKILSSSNTA